MTATWTIQETFDERFPFRIAVEQNGRVLFAVRAKAPWPGAGTQVFCLRERELAIDEFNAMLPQRPPVKAWAMISSRRCTK